MKYAEIAEVKKPVSRIIFGAAMSPFLENGDGSAILDGMVELGVNTFDLARVYQDAEQSFGRWMAQRENREQLVLISKCAHPSAEDHHRLREEEIRKDFAQSSEYLRTGYLDIYLLHRDDPGVPAGEIVEIFNALHAEGKIGAFGGSNWTHERITEANEYAYKKNLIPFTVSSPNFGLADQIADPWGGGCVTISGPSNREAREWYRANQMPVIAYSSLARGLFSGKIRSQEWEKTAELLDEPAIRGYVCEENRERLSRCEKLAEKYRCTVPQIAMAYIFCQNLNAFAVVSTSRVSRMQSNIEALDLNLTQEEIRYLDLR